MLYGQGIVIIVRCTLRIIYGYRITEREGAYPSAGIWEPRELKKSTSEERY